MSRQSIFRDFIGELQENWRDALPHVRKIKSGLGPTMPSASTFYAGFAPLLQMHVFVNFQHSTNAWQVGQFTINIILSGHDGPPKTNSGPFVPKDGRSVAEGRYRTSSILGRHRDMWWHLKEDEPSTIFDIWRPSNYDDNQTVIAEAIVDATREVRAALAKLGVELPDHST